MITITTTEDLLKEFRSNLNIDSDLRVEKNNIGGDSDLVNIIVNLSSGIIPAFVIFFMQRKKDKDPKKPFIVKLKGIEIKSTDEEELLKLLHDYIKRRISDGENHE